MKGKKKLTLKKQDIYELTRAEAKAVVGGAAPTFENPEYGGHCTNGCDDATMYFGGLENCTKGCTGGCPSVAREGCESQTVPIGCTPTYRDACHTDQNCTYTKCTQGCPNTINDATCTCP